MFNVKYNCYRNIGFIYEEQGKDELALKNLLDAIELDDSDVFTMYRVAKLALNQKQIFVAKSCFESCLKRNPNHWPSMDGLLQVFCMGENVMESFGWAKHCLEKNSKYKRGIDVLMEISERFSSCLDFLEDICQSKFQLDEETKAKWKKPDKSCFPEASYYEPVFVKPELDLDQFKKESFDWLSLGNLIINLFQYIKDLNVECLFLFKLDEFIKKEEKPVVEKEEIVENDVQVIDDEDDDSVQFVDLEKDENSKGKSESDDCIMKCDDFPAMPQIQGKLS